MLTELCSSIIGMNLATRSLVNGHLTGSEIIFQRFCWNIFYFRRFHHKNEGLTFPTDKLSFNSLILKKICCPHLPKIGHHLFIMIITNSLRISKLFCERISCLQLSRVFVHLECRTQPEPEVWNDVLAFHENQGWPIDFLEKNIYHF